MDRETVARGEANLIRHGVQTSLPSSPPAPGTHRLAHSPVPQKFRTDSRNCAIIARGLRINGRTSHASQRLGEKALLIFSVCLNAKPLRGKETQVRRKKGSGEMNQPASSKVPPGRGTLPHEQFWPPCAHPRRATSAGQGILLCSALREASVVHGGCCPITRPTDRRQTITPERTASGRSTPARGRQTPPLNTSPRQDSDGLYLLPAAHSSSGRSRSSAL